MNKIALLLLLLIPAELFCQNIYEPVQKNTLYVEVIGSGGILSLNYDRIGFQSNKHKVTGRIGFSNLLFAQINLYSLGVNYLYGRKHHLEAGIGITGWYDQGIQSVPTAQLGYRFQKPEGGFMLRAGIAPIFLYGDLSPVPFFILPIPSVGLGYSFKH